MTQGTCEKCKKVVIEDLEAYLEKYPNEKYVQCPYCGAQGTLE